MFLILLFLLFVVVVVFIYTLKVAFFGSFLFGSLFESIESEFIASVSFDVNEDDVVDSFWLSLDDFSLMNRSRCSLSSSINWVWFDTNDDWLSILSWNNYRNH